MSKHAGVTLCRAMVETRRISAPSGGDLGDKMRRVMLYIIYNTGVYLQGLDATEESARRLIPTTPIELAACTARMEATTCCQTRSCIWAFLSMVSSALPTSIIALSPPVSVAPVMRGAALQNMQRARLIAFIVAACSEPVYNLSGRFCPANAQRALEADTAIPVLSLVAACLSLYNCFTDVALAHMRSDGSDCYLLDLCTCAMNVAVAATVPANTARISLVEAREMNMPTAAISGGGGGEIHAHKHARAIAGLAVGDSMEACVEDVRSRFDAAACTALRAQTAGRPDTDFCLPFGHDYLNTEAHDGAMGVLNDHALPILLVCDDTPIGRIVDPTMCIFLYPVPPRVAGIMLAQAADSGHAFLVDCARSGAVASIEVARRATGRATVVTDSGEAWGMDFDITEESTRRLLNFLFAHMSPPAEDAFQFYAF